MASKTFDPYHKWLGIPPHEQPPSHYRLLRISEFESDQEVIELAYEKEMGALKRHEYGEYVDLVEVVGRKLVTARKCLLAADQKADYDAALKSRSSSNNESHLPVPAPKASDANPSSSAGSVWDELFGDKQENPAFQRLCAATIAGTETATQLAGWILVFRTSPSDRLAAYAKELGEAFYRWRPKKAKESENAELSFVTWVQDALSAAGLGNRIELVNTGDRYDSTRHNPRQRGVEISEVSGWVVLRDNGKVYTKASVSVM